jgi:hypothetical protein
MKSRCTDTTGSGKAPPVSIRSARRQRSRNCARTGQACDERELGRDLTGAVQYYVEWMQDYDAYTQALAPGVEGKEEARHDVSLRLTKLLLNQDLTLSLYIRYSITDNDCHIRPTCDYSISDNWTVSGGANIFAGENDYTFLGQFENNSNVFAALRYSF